VMLAECFGLCPGGRGQALLGAQPANFEKPLTAGRSLRLTSGGKAVTKRSFNLELQITYSFTPVIVPASQLRTCSGR
jgi:hypothetical protein